MIAETITQFPWAKLVYTIILVALIVVLLTEVWGLWWDRGIYLAPFEYVEDGEQKKEKGDSLPLRIADRHQRLAYAFRTSAERGLEEERSWTPTEVESPAAQLSKLEGVNLVVKDVNITDILGRLRRYVGGPRQISGLVEKSGGEWHAVIQLPSAWSVTGPTTPEPIRLDEMSDEDDVVFNIACRLLHYRASQVSDDISTVSPEEFCNWTAAWRETERMKRQRKSLVDAGDVDPAKVEELRTKVSRWIDDGARYPKFYSLRADLTDLLPPEKQATLEASSQADRLRYAVLLRIDPKERSRVDDPLDEQGAFGTLAEVRPAIPIENGQLEGPISDAWRAILSSAEKSITAVSSATCRIWPDKGDDSRDEEGYAVGFIAGENLLVTAASGLIAIDLGYAHGAKSTKEPKAVIVQCGSSSKAQQKLVTAIISPIYIGAWEEKGDHLAVFHFESSSLSKIQPVKLASSGEEDLPQGIYVALIGYPSPKKGGHYPLELAKFLLGEGPIVQRLMPGRIVDADSTLAQLAQNKVVGHSLVPLLENNPVLSDVSSLVGTGGGPILNLHTGRVVGVHVGGIFPDIKVGKFGVGNLITQEILDSLIKATTTPGPDTNPPEGGNEPDGTAPSPKEIAPTGANQPP